MKIPIQAITTLITVIKDLVLFFMNKNKECKKDDERPKSQDK